MLGRLHAAIEINKLSTWIDAISAIILKIQMLGMIIEICHHEDLFRAPHGVEAKKAEQMLVVCVQELTVIKVGKS